MKILFVIDQMSRGGIENRLISTVSCMMTLGYEPVVISMSRSGELLDRLSQTNAKIFSVTDNIKDIGFFKPRMIGRLRRIIREESPDVIHLCDIVSGHMGRIACLGLGIPVVYQLCSMRPHKKLKYRLAAMALSACTDHYIAVSYEVWSAVGKWQNIACRPSSIIHNGVNTKLFSNTSAIDTKKFFPALDGPIIFSCGRLVALKNIDLLLESFSVLREKNKKLHLLIIGDGSELEVLKALAGSLGINNSVSFVGFRDDVPAIFQALAKRKAVFALPSEYEGFSNAFAEALYCGIPVVISRKAAPKDVSGEGILYCELEKDSLADSLFEVLQDDCRYADMKKSALSIGSNLTIENNVNQLIDVYKRLITSKSINNE